MIANVSAPSPKPASGANAHSIAIALLVLVVSAAAAAAQTPPVSFTPLNDLGSGLYLNQFQGGLYPNGSNDVPAAHAADGLARAAAIRPLDMLGQPNPAGKYALISIGMSNTTQEFCSGNQPGACQPSSFMGQAAAHQAVNHTSLSLVDGADGGKSAAFWDSPTDPDYDRIVTQWLTPSGLSEQQVRVAWVKVANPGPIVSLPNTNADAYRLVGQMGNIARALKVRYPNMEQVLFSSRIYAGYATTQLNPEPYAYESGLAVKWLVEAQINQMSGGGVDPRAGDLDYTSGVAPWIAWGPYLWADGMNPRSDGLIWEPGDFQSDGTHPAASGVQKVGSMLLDFMLNSEFTKPWFLATMPGDYNRNGAVDAADYVVWRNTQGQTGTGLAADGNGDEMIDTGDYNVWRGNFGAITPSGAGLAAIRAIGPAVPEPTSLVLLLLGGTAAVAVLLGPTARR